MHRSRKSIATAAVALTGVLAMAGVATAAHGRSTPRSHLSDDPPTTLASGGTGGSGALGGTGGSGEIGGTGPVGGTGLIGGSGGTGAVGGSGGTGAINEPGDDHGVEPVGHDANDDRGNDAAGHDANDDRGNDATTTSVPTPSTTLAPNASGVQTFTVAGGNVTVDIENGVLTFVRATPNPGFTIDKSETRADRIEVEFRNGDVQSRVRVRFEDGRLRVENGRLRVENGDH
jgi:hypothetical protein